MAKTVKPIVKAKKAPVEKKTPIKKVASKKPLKKEVPTEEVQLHGIDPIVEAPPIEEVIIEGIAPIDVPYPKPEPDHITHRIEAIEGSGNVWVFYSDGSTELMPAHEAEKLPAQITVTKPTPKPLKSKEEMDIEAEWMAMGKIEHYNQFIKK
jgi:hypothetical protein